MHALSRSAPSNDPENYISVDPGQRFRSEMSAVIHAKKHKIYNDKTVIVKDKGPFHEDYYLYAYMPLN